MAKKLVSECRRHDPGTRATRSGARFRIAVAVAVHVLLLSNSSFTSSIYNPALRPWVAPVRRVGRLAIWDKPERSGGIPALDGLRAIAVALVLVGHGGIPGVGGGFIGVDIFFVLSGFIMAHTAAEEFGKEGAPMRFFRRRCARVIPL